MQEHSQRTGDLLEEKIRSYSDMVYRLAFAQMGNRSDAEDVYQEVFLRFCRENRFESEEHERAWLLRVTINCARKYFRSAFVRHRASIPEESLPGDSQWEERSEVGQAVAALPRRYRAVIHLFYYEDMSGAQIAALLGVSEGAVRTRLARARTLLRQSLKEEIR